jgi:hypothetical protein
MHLLLTREAEIFSRSVIVRRAWVRANAYSNRLGAVLLGILSRSLAGEKYIYEAARAFSPNNALAHRPRERCDNPAAEAAMSKRACISVLPRAEKAAFVGQESHRAPPVQKRGSG